MPIHRIKQGLRIPVDGEPESVVDRHRSASRVALLAEDYVGLKPTFHVTVGQSVRRGELLFEDKRLSHVRYTAPAAGTVAAIHRAERRAFQSLVIELSAAERQGRGVQVPLASFSGRHPSALTSDAVRGLLVESGLWTALRGRPFSHVADPNVRPRSIFVTSIDTEPLAPDVEVILRGREADLERGLSALGHLTDGPVFFCTSDRFALPVPSLERVRHERFAGPHPAGTVGIHIHRLDPAGRGRVVWYVGYQDVLAIGRLFGTGEIDAMRVIALAGPAIARPRLLPTRIGASTGELVQGELREGDVRIVSGSVLSGRMAVGPVQGFLGRYHRQVSVLFEGRQRELLGWATPGFDKFSAFRVFFSRLQPRRRFALTTTTNGSRRAIVPMGVYETVMPFDLPPTYLLKALVTGDVERAEQLGCLELDEEDLALCTFVCPGKHEYGPYLRQILSAIEKEG